jgi:hypothetical protein
VPTLHGSNPPVSAVHLREGALPAALFRRVNGGVRALGGERLQSTYQTTFWFDLVRPSSIVEEAIVSLRRFLPESFAGVEWWLSRMYTNRIRVDFHRDRDERRSLRGGAIRHPRVSSVLFLNRVRGGALAVTAQAPDPRHPCCVPLPLDAELIAPRPNRLVWFAGSLTHGVLDAANRVPQGVPRSKGELRLSVVMNWWTTRPLAVPTFADSGVYAPLRARGTASSTGSRSARR